MTIRCGIRVLASFVLIGVVLPVCLRYTVSGKEWIAIAAHQPGTGWYNPFTGYWVRNLPDGYTEEAKVEMLGDVVAHSALITCKVLKDGAPATNVPVVVEFNDGPHAGWTQRVKTNVDGIARVTLRGDGRGGSDGGYVYADASFESGGESQTVPIIADWERDFYGDNWNFYSTQPLCR